MSIQFCLLQFALAELFAQSSNSGMVTLADQYGLMAAVMEETLDEEERVALDRLLYAVYKGRVKVSDQLSVVR